MSKVKILAIETSADETSVAVWKKGRLASNIIYSQIAQHRKTGGIVPEVAARAHIPKIIPAIKLATAQAGIQLSDLDAIAVTRGPGLITSLRIGVDTAKALAFALGKPIIGINHLEGHLLSGLLTRPSATLSSKRRGAACPPKPRRRRGGEEVFPALGLIVSGGHTMLVLVWDIGKYKILGETQDDAAGEAFDKIAKILGLAYPGGPVLAKLAEKGNPKSFDLPRPMINQKNYNFSFAGLKTAVLYLWQDIISSPPPLSSSPPAGRAGRRRGTKGEEVLKADIAASAQQAIVDVLVEKTLRAAKEYKAKSILLGGGVAANKKLKKTLKNQIQTRLNSKLLTPDSDLTTDNAGMIAIAAYYHYIYGNTTTFDRIKAEPNLELASWR